MMEIHYYSTLESSLEQQLGFMVDDIKGQIRVAELILADPMDYLNGDQRDWYKIAVRNQIESLYGLLLGVERRIETIMVDTSSYKKVNKL